MEGRSKLFLRARLSNLERPKINYNILTAIKNFFILGIKNNCEIRDKDEPKKILECYNNSMLYKEENYESFSDDVFKNAIGEEREKFISFL